jgi:hypothetical protein
MHRKGKVLAKPQRDNSGKVIGGFNVLFLWSGQLHENKAGRRKILFAPIAVAESKNPRSTTRYRFSSLKPQYGKGKAKAKLWDPFGSVVHKVKQCVLEENHIEDGQRLMDS